MSRWLREQKVFIYAPTMLRLAMRAGSWKALPTGD
jgi:hypothetical protein